MHLILLLVTVAGEQLATPLVVEIIVYKHFRFTSGELKVF